MRRLLSNLSHHEEEGASASASAEDLNREYHRCVEEIKSEARDRGEAMGNLQLHNEAMVRLRRRRSTDDPGDAPYPRRRGRGPNPLARSWNAPSSRIPPSPGPGGGLRNFANSFSDLTTSFNGLTTSLVAEFRDRRRATQDSAGEEVIPGRKVSIINDVGISMDFASTGDFELDPDFVHLNSKRELELPESDGEEDAQTAGDIVETGEILAEAILNSEQDNKSDMNEEENGEKSRDNGSNAKDDKIGQRGGCIKQSKLIIHRNSRHDSANCQSSLCSFDKGRSSARGGGSSADEDSLEDEFQDDGLIVSWEQRRSDFTSSGAGCVRGPSGIGHDGVRVVGVRE